jgi:hypothetical protein
MKTLLVAAMLLAASVAQATNLFDEQGNRIGMTTETRDVTTFYDTCGRKVGTWRTINGTDHYFDARGKRRNGVDLSARRCKQGGPTVRD